MDFSVLLADLRKVAEQYRGKTTDPQVSTNAYVHLFTKVSKNRASVRLGGSTDFLPWRRWHSSRTQLQRNLHLMQPTKSLTSGSAISIVEPKHWKLQSKSQNAKSVLCLPDSSVETCNRILQECNPKWPLPFCPSGKDSIYGSISFLFFNLHKPNYSMFRSQKLSKGLTINGGKMAVETMILVSSKWWDNLLQN